MNCSNPIFDCHIHFGQFHESFYSPEMLVELMNKIGIQKYFIMPISTKEIVDFDNDWNTSKKIMRISEGKAIPALLIDTNMIKASPDLSAYDIMPYKYLKIHGYVHDWHKHPKLLQKVFDCAKFRNLPIMFHTGGRFESEPLQYLNICQKNYNATVILAHGRPIDQTLQVMEQCSNVWADTAFMPVEDLVQLIESGFEDRILFGTDFPITKYYYSDTNDVEWYKNRISEFRSCISDPIFKKITNSNFDKIFI